MSVSFAIDRSELDAALAKVVNASRALPDGMAQVARQLQTHVQDEFSTDTDPWGVRWQPLALSTIRAKAKRGTIGSAILIDSGAMLSSLTAFSDPASATVQIGHGFNPAYPAFNQFGTDRLAARAMLPLHIPGIVDLPDTWAAQMIATLEIAFQGQIA